LGRKRGCGGGGGRIQSRKKIRGETRRKTSGKSK
jgi:hypothetical protein